MFKVGDRVRVEVPKDSWGLIKDVHEGQTGTVVRITTTFFSDYVVAMDNDSPISGAGWEVNYPESWLRHEDEQEHRRFVLQRDEDETGVSGTGVVAEGVEFSDGVVALRWIVPPGRKGSGNPTSVVFHDNGIDSVDKIHGHNGKTKIVWID